MTFDSQRKTDINRRYKIHANIGQHNKLDIHKQKTKQIKKLKAFFF